ncbi:hypothetical protein [Variovorax sp. MHTC-1]|uniref:hypothetical protein n=1 Tax=Variovorax sp. MHTC-1 TaxID=2495593 RepID=UPI000F85D5E9|nr:hypothetical protein [Variovorax sp. MHTC-1]RST56804.1 hypothetical protein EJI01_03000 [Variovorax sp. MHTC-1]
MNTATPPIGANVHAASCVAAAFAKWGVEPSAGSPEDFGRYIVEESRRWRATVASGALTFE